jgi:hypothetical protein
LLAALKAPSTVAARTIWESGALPDATKLAAPLYSATMSCDPTASALVEHIAELPTNATSEQRSGGPILKSTVPAPFGFEGEAVTVAVNVTDAP